MEKLNGLLIKINNKKYKLTLIDKTDNIPLYNLINLETGNYYFNNHMNAQSIIKILKSDKEIYKEKMTLIND